MQRGAGDIKTFNAALTKCFCERNRISMIIRAHEVKMGGYELQHSGLLCTVFSARNYTRSLKNDAALVLLQPDDKGRIQVKFKTLKHLE
jgi:serine/threonine-protein phosphatase 5